MKLIFSALFFLFAFTIIIISSPFILLGALASFVYYPTKMGFKWFGKLVILIADFLKGLALGER